jgi:hypothetical protein
MIVKEASYPSPERRCLLQIADGTSTVEELSLELCGNGIPAHKHGRAQALQNLLFFFGKGSTVVVILPPLNRLIDMDCHPFFVFGKRRVSPLKILEFPRFVRRTRYVGEQRPEFGCFGSESVRSEHLTRPFPGRREHNGSPPCRHRGLHGLVDPRRIWGQSHRLARSAVETSARPPGRTQASPVEMADRLD